MARRRAIGLSAAGVTVAAAVIAFALTASGASSKVASVAKKKEQGTCYPSNDFAWTETAGFATAAGEFSSKSFAKESRIGALILEDNNPPPSTQTTNENEVPISADATVDVFAKVTGNEGVPVYVPGTKGAMQGHANVTLTNFKLNPNESGETFTPEEIAHSQALLDFFKGHKVRFKSRCLAEAVMEPLDSGAQDSALEAEFEGTVDFWPDVTGSTKAVLTIHAADEKGQGTPPEIQIGIERGTTCNEPSPETTTPPPHVIEVSGKIESPSDNQVVTNNPPEGESGRASLPNGVTPSEGEVCPDVTLGE